MRAQDVAACGSEHGRILARDVPQLDLDLNGAEVAANSTAVDAEAKAQATEVGLKPPRRRRAEQPAKAGTNRDRGELDGAMNQRPNV
jgi:hypothetical protein